jgi:transcriptional regulator with XRE-family HTH domain
LRQWRLEAGFSQRELSRRLKKAITYASKVECLERRIDPIELSDWARACNVAPATVIRTLWGT